MVRTKTRTVRAYVWLTPTEKESWNAKATAAGMNLNEFIRCCVERRAIAPVPPEVNRVTAVELGRIGVNLNQLVRAMNTAIAVGQLLPDVKEALNQVKAVDEAVKKIKSKLLHHCTYEISRRQVQRATYDSINTNFNQRGDYLAKKSTLVQLPTYPNGGKVVDLLISVSEQAIPL